MKLWVLRPVENLPESDDPWEPWYDKAFGFVVRAKTEQEAREFAQSEAGDEERGGQDPWKNPKLSTCTELRPNGDAGVVIVDFHAA